MSIFRYSRDEFDDLPPEDVLNRIYKIYFTNNVLDKVTNLWQTVEGPRLCYLPQISTFAERIVSFARTYVYSFSAFITKNGNKAFQEYAKGIQKQKPWYWVDTIKVVVCPNNILKQEDLVYAFSAQFQTSVSRLYPNHISVKIPTTICSLKTVFIERR